MRVGRGVLVGSWCAVKEFGGVELFRSSSPSSKNSTRVKKLLTLDPSMSAFRTTVRKLGGGGHFPHPKYVWSPSGGWWGNTAQGPRNSMIAVGVMGGTSALIYMLGESLQKCTTPDPLAPLQTWSLSKADLSDRTDQGAGHH